MFESMKSLFTPPSKPSSESPDSLNLIDMIKDMLNIDKEEPPTSEKPSFDPFDQSHNMLQNFFSLMLLLFDPQALFKES